VSNLYDIAVYGASVAGYVAATALAKLGWQVILLDVPSTYSEQIEPSNADWIPADTFDVCPFLRRIRAAVVEQPFRTVQFYSTDLTSKIHYRTRSIMGFTLSIPTLLRKLKISACQEGIEYRRYRGKPEIVLQEQWVLISQSGASRRREIRAKILIMAKDSPAEAAFNLGQPLRGADKKKFAISEMAINLPKSKQGDFDNVMHIFQLPVADRFGMLFGMSNSIITRIVYQNQLSTRWEEQIMQFATRLQRAGIIPEGVKFSKAKITHWFPPAAQALELDTHVLKRTLLIGSAGGFASGITGAALDASVRSAIVAAEVADKALKSNRCQETLADFKDQWRDDIADRIRPFTTPLRMIFPMALSNKMIAARLARAMLFGENI